MKRASWSLLLPFALAAGALALAQGQGPRRMEVPPPMAAGTFEGTWYYVDPEFEIAVFIYPDKTGMLKLRYQVHTKSGSDIKTDEGGYGKYIDDAGNLVEVLFTGTLKGQNLIEGHHQRTVHTKKKKLVESGDFEIYRAEKGRKLVLHYPVYKVESIDASGQASASSEIDKYRLFRKASDIVVDFEEIPFQ